MPHGAIKVGSVEFVIVFVAAIKLNSAHPNIMTHPTFLHKPKLAVDIEINHTILSKQYSKKPSLNQPILK
jgi:hypothetical protein